MSGSPTPIGPLLPRQPTGAAPVDAVLVDHPRQRTLGDIVKVVRLALAGLGCVCSLAFTWWLWSITEDRLTNPPGDRYAHTPDQEAAKADLPRLEAELKEQAASNEKLREFAREWPKQFEVASEPATSVYLAQLDGLLSQRGEVEDYQLDAVRRLTPNADEKRQAIERVRREMKSGSAQAGRICRLVLAIGDGELTGELLAAMRTSDRVKQQFRFTEVNGLVDLLERLPLAESLEFLPVVIEFVPYLRNDFRQQLSGFIGGNPERAAAATAFAHHRTTVVRDLVRPNLSDDALWQAAFDSLKTEPACAFAAAAWIAAREVEPARQKQVVAALLPKLWLTDGAEYPAIAAIGRWGDERCADAIERAGRSAGADRAAADVCRLLAKWSPELLAGVVASQLGSHAWNAVAAPVMGEDPQVAAAVKAALRESAPLEAHAPYIEALFSCASPDDVPWLTVYRTRLSIADLPRGREMNRQIAGIIARLEKAKGEEGNDEP